MLCIPFMAFCHLVGGLRANPKLCFPAQGTHQVMERAVLPGMSPQLAVPWEQCSDPPLAALRSAWAGAHSRYKASAQILFKPGLMQGRFHGHSLALHTFPHLREALITLAQIPQQEALRKLLSSSCSCSHLASCSLLLAPCKGPLTQRMGQLCTASM